MDIEDILKTEKFKELDNFLTKEMYLVAGEKLVDKINSIFDEDSGDARKWFYSKIISLGGKRPYDLCKESKRDQVYDCLGRIEHGTFG